MEKVRKYIEDNKDTFLSQWFEVLRIPSVSAQKEHKEDIRSTAEWLYAFLTEKLGMSARIIETDSNPLVYAESEKVENAPTVLLYGHYDVQPAEPFEEWKTYPFEPTIVDGKVYCRGANDDKGQWCAHLCGLQTYLALNETLPLQVKCIFEGEEEVGSSALSIFLEDESNLELLSCDALIVSDTSAAGPGIPAITYGLRGVMGFELKLCGPNHDLHSGIYGGSVYNPAIALSKVLSALIDDNGKIQVPHFYDDVIELTQHEREALAQNPYNRDEEEKILGITGNFGEPEFSVLERRGARPSLDINGLTSGYQGEGGKTIIPSWASGKFTFRTVPNQDPEKLQQNVRNYIKSLIPPGICCGRGDDLEYDEKYGGLKYDQGSGGMVTHLEGKFINAASVTLGRVFGCKPRFVRDGGSIPIVAELRKKLDAEAVLIGFGLDDDGIHAPNEKFNTESFFNGILTSALLWDELGKIGTD